MLDIFDMVWVMKRTELSMKFYLPGQGLTPLFVSSANDIPLMNLVWFLPAVIGCIVTAMKV